LLGCDLFKDLSILSVLIRRTGDPFLGKADDPRTGFRFATGSHQAPDALIAMMGLAAEELIRSNLDTGTWLEGKLEPLVYQQLEKDGHIDRIRKLINNLRQSRLTGNSS